MRFKFSVSAFFLFTIVSGLYAQKTLGKKINLMPADYREPTGAAPAPEKFLPFSYSNLWVAYSQSDGNYSYTEPGETKQQLKKMNFMDAFWVIDHKEIKVDKEEKITWLQLAKWESLTARDFDPKTGELKKELEYYGWVPESNMLAWRHCLIDPVSRFSIKALTTSNNECLKNPENCIPNKSKIVSLFKNPGRTIPSTNDVRLFEFLYVYKRIGNAVLVGRQDELLSGESKLASKKILGWTDSNILKEWKQRLVLEPNWDDDAVNERKARKIKTSIFYKQEDATKFMDDAVVSDVLWDKDPYDKRWPAEMKRLPLLDANIKDLENIVVKTGVVSPIYNKEGKQVFETAEEIKLRRESGEQRENLRKVNIVFLIDGSRYMTPFKSNILQTIAKFSQDLKQKDAEMEDMGIQDAFKLGAVIYRTTADAKCPGGDLSTESKDLDNRYNEVVEFVEAGMEKTGCNDKEQAKAYYKGLQQALRMFGKCKKQSNIIVVIGSAGNSDDPNYVSYKKKVLADMIDYQVGLLVFQVQSGYERCYTDFLRQSKDLINASAVAIWDSINSLTDQEVQIPEMVKGNNMFRLLCPKESPIPGQIMYADASAPMNSDTLQESILRLIEETKESKDKILEGIDSKLNGIGAKVPINPGMLLFLKNMNVDEETLKKTSYANAQLYVEGYTAFKPTGLSNSLYKICVFMSESEFVSLKTNLRKISAANLGVSDLRGRMEDGFKAIVNSYFGEREAKKALSSKTPGELLSMMSGLPTKNPILQKFKIDQIQNRKLFSDAELLNLQNDLESKISALEDYAQEEKNYLRNGEKRFLWVPSEFFP